MATELEKRQLEVSRIRSNRTIDLFKEAIEFESSNSEEENIETNKI